VSLLAGQRSACLATFAVDRAKAKEKKSKDQQLLSLGVCVCVYTTWGRLDKHCPSTGHDQMKMCSPVSRFPPLKRCCRRLSLRVHNYYSTSTFHLLLCCCCCCWCFCGHVWRCTRISGCRMLTLPLLRLAFEFVISLPASHFSYLAHFECHLATPTAMATRQNPTR